jgi:plasmid stabilization system protein ParE
MTELHITAAAEREIAAAARWYARQSAGLETRFLDCLNRLLRVVAARPGSFQIVHRDLRRALVPRFPYAVFFRLVDDQVRVVACMHTARFPGRWETRERLMAMP